MEAGRELDALVAEGVMEWKVTHRGRRVMPGLGYKWRPEVGGFSGYAEARRWIASVCPKYSTEWGPAGTVVEKMRERGWYWDVFAGTAAGGAYVGARFDLASEDEEGEGRQMHTAYADTAPLAICIAALMAVGVGVSA